MYYNSINTINSIRPSRGKKNCNIDTSWPLQTDMLRTMLNVTMFQSRALTRCTPYTLVCFIKH